MALLSHMPIFADERAWRIRLRAYDKRCFCYTAILCYIQDVTDCLFAAIKRLRRAAAAMP